MLEAKVESLQAALLGAQAEAERQGTQLRTSMAYKQAGNSAASAARESIGQQREMQMQSEIDQLTRRAEEAKSRADEATRLRLNQLMLDARLEAEVRPVADRVATERAELRTILSEPKLTGTGGGLDSRRAVSMRVELDSQAGASQFPADSPRGVYERALASYTREMRRAAPSPLVEFYNGRAHEPITITHDAIATPLMTDVVQGAAS